MMMTKMQQRISTYAMAVKKKAASKDSVTVMAKQTEVKEEADKQRVHIRVACG